MVRNVLRLAVALNSGSKSFQSSGENSYLCGHEQ